MPDVWAPFVRLVFNTFRFIGYEYRSTLGSLVSPEGNGHLLRKIVPIEIELKLVFAILELFLELLRAVAGIVHLFGTSILGCPSVHVSFE